jgi:lipoyl synthase
MGDPAGGGLMAWSELARQRPAWMTVRAPSANGRFGELRGIMREGGLHTVCEEARCPNIGECWGRGTATFQILGDVCTRACRYCAVTSGRPEAAPEPLEPLRVARAVQRMGLRHVVVTSVDRDDLEDRGAGHFAATIRAIRRASPECGVEVLVPDFLGFREQALRVVLEAAPDVFNHNIETAERLYRRVRPKGDYRKALDLLDRAKDVWAELHPKRPLMTKSGIIVGMGESDDEVVGVMRDLRAHRVDVVTIGQYLQPTARHLALDRWVTPEQFRWLREQGEAMGFGSVFAGPLVRSSYRADEQRLAAAGESRVVAH